MFGKRKNKDHNFDADSASDAFARDTLQDMQEADDPFISTGDTGKQSRYGQRDGFEATTADLRTSAVASHTAAPDGSGSRRDAHIPGGRPNPEGNPMTNTRADMPQPVPVDPFAEEEQMRTRPSKLSQYITWILSGNILSRAEVRKQYPYICFMALLTFLYITNIFNTQKLYRKQDRLSSQIKELRSKSLTLSSIRMSATRQSAILRQLEERGIDLKESLSPPMIMER